MKAVDTNILLHAFVAGSPFHEKARQCVTALAEGEEEWAIPWPCLHEFLAIATNARLFSPPIPASLAMERVETWCESPSLILLGEDDDYLPQLKECLLDGHIAGGMVHDARIAALCLRAGVAVLYTADRDFSRFRKLRVENPLSA